MSTRRPRIEITLDPPIHPTLRVAIQSTKLAPVLIVVDEVDTLVGLRFLDRADPAAAAEPILARLRAKGHAVVVNPRACAGVTKAVREFVAGRSQTLELRARPVGTPFQQSVWKAVKKVGYGKTISYRELASKVGRPTAWRAVARANATNPVALVIPCHRVIGSDGKPTGYNGGVAVKAALLDLESRLNPARPASRPRSSSPSRRTGSAARRSRGS